MKRFAVSALVAGGLFLGAVGAAGAAQATELYVGPNGAGVTAVDGSGIGVGPNGISVWMPDAHRDYDGRYYDGGYYDGRHYDRYPNYGHPYRGCFDSYCGR